MLGLDLILKTKAKNDPKCGKIGGSQHINSTTTVLVKCRKEGERGHIRAMPLQEMVALHLPNRWTSFHCKRYNMSKCFFRLSIEPHYLLWRRLCADVHNQLVR